MQNQDYYQAKDALRLMKAGYRLYAIIDKRKEDFRLEGDIIIVISENKGININEYSFLDIYKDTLFFLSENNDEEAVDPQRDKEYYSWKQ